MLEGGKHCGDLEGVGREERTGVPGQGEERQDVKTPGSTRRLEGDKGVSPTERTAERARAKWKDQRRTKKPLCPGQRKSGEAQQAGQKERGVRACSVLQAPGRTLDCAVEPTGRT